MNHLQSSPNNFALPLSWNFEADDMSPIQGDEFQLELSSKCTTGDTLSVSPVTNCANHTIQDWPGDFGFQVRFGPHRDSNSRPSWTYYDGKRKLYTKKATALPVHFITDAPPPVGTSIFVVAVFRDPNERLKNVKRCPTHSSELHESDSSREHWIRCDHPATFYGKDEENGDRHYISVPFERPQDDGSNALYTYFFRFMCLNTCEGGPSRQATEIIFILRSPQGKDLARRCVQVKVCACPQRDRQHDEKLADVSTLEVGRKVNRKRIYTLETYDKEIYEVLLKVKEGLELREAHLRKCGKRMKKIKLEPPPNEVSYDD